MGSYELRFEWYKKSDNNADDGNDDDGEENEVQKRWKEEE